MAKKPHKPMSKAQLMTHLATATELPKKNVVALFEELTRLAYVEAKKDKGFKFPGFGTLIVVKRKARIGRNPQTGEALKIPAKKALKFRLSKQAKDGVLA